MAPLVKVGVIGTGFGASVVAPAFAAAEDCEVVDVVTPRDGVAVEALCGRRDLDLISIHSPPFLHLEHVRRAIDRRHAVLCDKPFGLNAEEAAAMTQLADQAELLNLLNFERRFDPGREALRAVIQDGVIGTPHHFQYSRSISVPGRPFSWLNRKELGGGWLGGQGSHLIDCCRWLFGEITEASALMRTVVTMRPDSDGELQECNAEDGFVASLRTSTGVSAVIDCSVEAPVSTPERTVVVGDQGMIELDDAGLTITTSDGDVSIQQVDLQGKGSLILSMERWAALACQAVRTGIIEPGWPTFADGLACAVVMDHMRSAAIDRIQPA